MRLLIVTGLPATGKSTLATELAARYRLPLLAKDIFKESLLGAAGAVDAARSRKLSDISFDMLFAQLGQLAGGRMDAVLEGNFRAGQHEAVFSTLTAARIVQILCRVDEEERRRRIAARVGDPARHPGHGDAHATRDAGNDSFLELPGERLLFATNAAATSRDELLQQLDRWWHSAGTRQPA